MSLEQSLHSRWSGDAALSALLPPSRVFTGPALGEPPFPYAVWLRTGYDRLTRTSSRQVAHVTLSLHLHARDLPTLKHIVDAVLFRFDRQAFASDGVTVHGMRCNNQQEHRSADDAWQASLQFVAQVQ